MLRGLLGLSLYLILFVSRPKSSLASFSTSPSVSASPSACVAALVTTLAGNASNAAGNDGVGTAASLINLGGIAADLSGNLYVGQGGQNPYLGIRFINTTSAATSSPSQLASSNAACGLAMSSYGALYYPVSDNYNKAIFSAVMTPAPIGPNIVYQFSVPPSYTANPDNLPNGSNSLYFGATFNAQVWKVVISTGVMSVVAGTGANGFANGASSSAQFYNPMAAVPTNDGLWLLVADTWNHQIRRVALSNGATTTFVGGGGSNIVGNANGIGTNALMGISNLAIGFALDSDNNGYLVDQDYALIRRIDYATLAVTTVAGTGSNGYADGLGTSAAFYTPQGLTLFSNIIYVSERGSSPSFAGRVRTILLCNSSTATPSGSAAATVSATLSASATRSANSSTTATSTATQSGSAAATVSATLSASATRSANSSSTASQTWSANTTATMSATATSSVSVVVSVSATQSGSITQNSNATLSAAATSNGTSAASVSATQNASLTPGPSASTMTAAATSNSSATVATTPTVSALPSASSASTSPTGTHSGSPGVYEVATVSIVVANILSCASATGSSAAMGNTFIATTGIPPTWLASTVVQCGPSLQVTLRRRELQASPTATMSPAVGSTVIFTYVVLIPLNAPSAQVSLAQNAVITTTTASTTSLTASLVAGTFPSAAVVSVYGSVNGVACGPSPLPSCASQFDSPSTSASPSSVGAIAGGVVGAVVVIGVIALVVYFSRRARARAAETATLKAAAAAAQAGGTPRPVRSFTLANPIATTPGAARSLSSRTMRSTGIVTAQGGSSPRRLPSARRSVSTMSPVRAPSSTTLVGRPASPSLHD